MGDWTLLMLLIDTLKAFGSNVPGKAKGESKKKMNKVKAQPTELPLREEEEEDERQELQETQQEMPLYECDLSNPIINVELPTRRFALAALVVPLQEKALFVSENSSFLKTIVALVILISNSCCDAQHALFGSSIRDLDLTFASRPLTRIVWVIPRMYIMWSSVHSRNF